MNEPTSSIDLLTTWLDREATLRVVALEATTTCRALCILHDLDGDAARDLSEAVAGGLLWASDLKASQTLSLQIELGFRTFHVDATATGLVRAMATTRSHESPIARVVVRRMGLHGLLYQSVVDIPSRDIAAILGGHSRQSDQQEVHADLRCQLDSQGLPGRVQGALLRGFPSTPAGALAGLVGAWKQRGPWGLENPCADLGERTWDRLSSQEIHHHCPCSRDRALGSIRALGHDALLEAAAKGESMEVVCDFCRSVHSFGSEEFLPSSSD